MEWTEENLSALRSRMDPPADELVKRIAEGGAIEETNRILRSIISNHQEVPIGLPSYLYDWMNESCQLPDWVDMERIRGANKFFREDGPSLSLFACTTGFLWMYACANGSKVLAKSRRLSEDAERRIAETAQFILEVSDKGGLEADGGGLRMIQKVRLMHSSIRWFIHNKGDWDYETWGAPVNQEDMLGTILVIGTQVLDDMQAMGIKMKKKYMDDWWYLWRAIGEVMGVEPELLPIEREEASKVIRLIINHQLEISQDSIDLTKALLDFFDEMIPGNMFDGVIISIIRQTMGKELSDMLEVPNTKWERIIGRKTFRLLGFADFISGPFGGIIERLALSFMNGKSRRILNKEPATFSMSNHLRSTFQRKALEAIEVYEQIWEDGELNDEEIQQLNELQQQLALSDKEMKKFATLGAINAAIADEKVDSREIELIETLAKEAELSDENISFILSALEDGQIDAVEREMLNRLLGHAV